MRHPLKWRKKCFIFIPTSTSRGVCKVCLFIFTSRVTPNKIKMFRFTFIYSEVLQRGWFGVLVKNFYVKLRYSGQFLYNYVYVFYAYILNLNGNFIAYKVTQNAAHVLSTKFEFLLMCIRIWNEL